MASELNPCPFCGAKANLRPEQYYYCGDESDKRTKYYIECSQCATHKIGSTEFNVQLAWNTRADTDNLAAVRSKIEVMPCRSDELAFKREVLELLYEH